MTLFHPIWVTNFDASHKFQFFLAPHNRKRAICQLTPCLHFKVIYPDYKLLDLNFPQSLILVYTESEIQRPMDGFLVVVQMSTSKIKNVLKRIHHTELKYG